jgi:hypothetical protein
MRIARLLKHAVECLAGCVALCHLAAQQPSTPTQTGEISAVMSQGKGPSATRPAEDWSVLAVDPASLGPLSYAVLGEADNSDFTRELIRIQWRSSDPIDLYVIKPHGAKKPPVILYLYGFPSDTDHFRDDGWCRRATRGGFAAVGFVSALTGQRYANRPMKEWFISELQESLGTSTHDVQMILNYLAKRGDLATNEVGMFGQGSGGSIALLAASVDARITVVDVLDPWGDWPDWVKMSPEVPEEERATYLRPEFLKRVANLDPILYLPHLKLRGLRVEQVMDEPVTPTDAKLKIGAVVQLPQQLLRYDNERAHLNAWRVSGLSGWIRDEMTRPPTVASVTSVQDSAMVHQKNNQEVTNNTPASVVRK